MRYVLGMAKSCLNLNGAKRQKVELDFLRLVYAKRKLVEEGHSAEAVLAVMTNTIAQQCGHPNCSMKPLVQEWGKKYEAVGVVHVLVIKLDSQDDGALRKEKKRNVDGMRAGASGRETDGKSAAPLGRDLVEHYLSAEITRRYRGVQVLAKLPFDIRWDYCGTCP
jgi:hypothetical protein